MKTAAVLIALFFLGIGGALAVGETEGTVSVCATATTPAHTVAVDGTDVQTIPGDTASNCVTSTYTIPTSTETGPTTTVTSTVPGPTTTVTSTVTSTTTTTTPVDPAPGPIAGQGYHLAFADEFSGTVLDTASWNDHMWYMSSPPAGSIVVGNGIIRLISHKAQGSPQVNVASDRKRIFKFGYMEARMKWTGVSGAWPAWWLFSEAHRDSAPPPAAEIDIQEGDGRYPNGYNTALHENGGAGGHCQTWTADFGKGNLTVDWHTYGLLWTATTVRWYLDGQQVRQCAAYASTATPMFLIMDMVPGSVLNGSGNPVPAGDIESDFDWVRVWQQ